MTIVDFPILDSGILLVRSPHLISSIHYGYIHSLMACFPASLVLYGLYPPNFFPLPHLTQHHHNWRRHF
jgi:hypothetical protein